MLVFCKYSTPVQIIFKRRRDVTFDFVCYQSICCYKLVSISHSLQRAAVIFKTTVRALNLVIWILYIPKPRSSAWRHIRDIYSLCYWKNIIFFFWEWHCIIVSQFHHHTLMNVECIYIALPVNWSAIWLLIYAGLSDHCLLLTGWADICIAHWRQLSLILLAVPNYHHFFMQPGSQDSASLQGISPSSSPSYSL